MEKSGFDRLLIVISWNLKKDMYLLLFLRRYIVNNNAEQLFEVQSKKAVSEIHESG